MSRSLLDTRTELPAPVYRPAKGADSRHKIGLAVESMRRHMTDEGWQIFEGLERAGYFLFGYGLPNPETDLMQILKSNPSTVVLQDKREWDVQPRNFREPRARFYNVRELRERHDIFKLTILKDAQQHPEYHAESAREIGCHAWIVYYEPSRVKGLAQYVRPEHLIRTYHTIDSRIVPAYRAEREYGCLLSGALSKAYPLRERLAKHAKELPQTIVLHHPGYHRNGCATPQLIKFMSCFKVAICTASRYGYALRKIMEATAAGCVVLTDLPEDDRLPEIDGNLVRIPSAASVSFVADTIKRLIAEYNPARQKYFSDCCKQYYDFHAEGERLRDRIEELRCRYQTAVSH